MRVPKINSTQHCIQKPLGSVKQRKDSFLQKCGEVRHKRIKDISTKEIPIFGATIGLFSPLPFGFLVGYGVGKLVEYTVNAIKRK